MSPEERYRTDREFRVLVDVLANAIEECRFTSSEIREAGILASIHYETIHARPSSSDGQISPTPASPENTA